MNEHKYPGRRPNRQGARHFKPIYGRRAASH